MLLLAAVCDNARALQALDVEDGATVIVKASLREPTRIAIVNGRLTKVTNVKGRIEVKADADTGAIYVLAKNPDEFSGKAGLAPGTPNLFVTDDHGRTYIVKLVFQDWPAQSVVLQPPKEVSQDKAREWEQSDGYKQVIIVLIKKMAREETPDGYVVREVSKAIPAWKEATLTLDREYVGDAYLGEAYTITNTSPLEMRIQERELYRAGALAISIEYKTLAPGQSTRALVVRENSGDI